MLFERHDVIREITHKKQKNYTRRSGKWHSQEFNYLARCISLKRSLLQRNDWTLGSHRNLGEGTQETQRHWEERSRSEAHL
jgi:hypothetical protein